MQINGTILDPDVVNFSLKAPLSYPPKPQLTFAVKNLNVVAHNVSDEQIAVAYSIGMTESLRLIVDRDYGKPFVSLVVAIPGVEVSYFWEPEQLDTDDAEGLVRALSELLFDSGEFASVELAREDIERRVAASDRRLMPG